ncbi:MAG TPA: alpha/beta hydrolase-fold protein, partial [Coleofasciculaceae cyanobacterium]
GHSGGFFHTYDAFAIDQTAPHKLHLFIPRDYETSTDRYPVIYMNDGDTSFFPGGVVNKSWHMAEVLSTLYQNQQIRQAIVVAICPRDRDREYTHAPVWDRPCCGLETYAGYVAQSVKGFIDEQYRTLADAQNTMILGSSHGGLAAFYIATHYPDQFRLVGALSSSFWVGLDSSWVSTGQVPQMPFLSSLRSSQLIERAKNTLQNPEKRLKIYLDWGLVRQGGFHNAFIEDRATVRGREMRDLLVNEFGYRLNHSLFVVEDPQGDHTEEAWSRRVPDVLKLFFGT